MFAGVLWGPLLSLLLAVSLVFSAVTGGAVWRFQQIRVESAELTAKNTKAKLSNASDDVKTLKRQLVEVSAKRAELDRALATQRTEIDAYVKAAAARAQAVDENIAAARASIAPIRGQLANLAQRVKLAKPGATCSDAWADIRTSMQ
jgi:septal ring factor EnvC (AmiA/AmiB activator)